MYKYTNNIINENEDLCIQKIIKDLNKTANLLTVPKTQELYNEKNYEYLTKHQLQNAIYANKVKKQLNSYKFKKQLDKNLKQFFVKHIALDFDIDELDKQELYKSILNKKLTSYGAIKNKIIWLLNHHINRNLTNLQIAYICNCSVRYVSKIIHELRVRKILYKYKLTKAEIQANKQRLKNKYYLIKTYTITKDKVNWLFNDKRFWFFSNKEIKELITALNLKDEAEQAYVESVDFNIADWLKTL